MAVRWVVVPQPVQITIHASAARKRPWNPPCAGIHLPGRRQIAFRVGTAIGFFSLTFTGEGGSPERVFHRLASFRGIGQTASIDQKVE